VTLAMTLLSCWRTNGATTTVFMANAIGRNHFPLPPPATTSVPRGYLRNSNGPDAAMIRIHRTVPFHTNSGIYTTRHVVRHGIGPLPHSKLPTLS
jgi:hypothetical protein